MSDFQPKKWLPKLIGSLINFISYLSPTLSARITGYLFSKPKRKPIREWMLEFLQGSNQQELNTSIGTIQSYAWDKGSDKVLFIHGWESNASRWKYIIDDLLLKNISCCAIDAPAHGATRISRFSPFSYAECIKESVMTFKPNVIVAHSVGAYAALIYHFRYKPEKIKYVLMAPTFSLEHPSKVMFSILGLNHRAQEAFKRLVSKRVGMSFDDLNSQNFVNQSQPQGMLLHDTTDDTLPVSGSQKIMESAKGLEYKETEGYGHRLQHATVFNLIQSYILDNQSEQAN